MGFGVINGTATNSESYTEDYSVEVAEKLDSKGTIVDMTTHGGKKEVSEDFYLDGESTTITNEALNGQSGTTDIVTKHTLTEKNNEYQKVSITKVSALPSPA